MEITPDPRMHRSYLSQLVASLFIVSLFVLVGAMLVYGIEIFFLVFAGILFGILLGDMARWINRWLPVSDRIAVLIASAALVTVIGITGWLLVPSLSKQINQLSETLPRSLEQLQKEISRHGIGRSILAKTPPPGEVVANNGDMVRTISNAFKVTTMAIGNMVAIFFLGLFFAYAPEHYTRGIIALTPRHRETRAKEVLAELRITLSRWLQGRLIEMAIVTVLTVLGLRMLGVELALVLGLLAGLLAFIPNIGPVISVIPAIMVGMLDSPQTALYIVILYVAVQTVESYIITPVIQKKMVHLAPALVLSVQFLFGVMLGTMALAMATPLAAAVMVLVKMLYVHDILGKPTTLPGEKTE